MRAHPPSSLLAQRPQPALTLHSAPGCLPPRQHHPYKIGVVTAPSKAQLEPKKPANPFRLTAYDEVGIVPRDSDQTLHLGLISAHGVVGALWGRYSHQALGRGGRGLKAQEQRRQ